MSDKKASTVPVLNETKATVMEYITNLLTQDGDENLAEKGKSLNRNLGMEHASTTIKEGD